MASIDAEACSYCRVDDEEPPSTTVQFLSPRVVTRFSRPKRPRAIAERDIFSPGARRRAGLLAAPSKPGRFARPSTRRARPGVERLALAGPKSPADPGPARAGAGAFGRRAGGPVGGRRDAAGQHHALLHEPGLAGRPEPAAAADGDSHHRRVPPRRRRGRRSAGRGRRQPRAGPGPPLSRPRAAAGDRLLFELLPLLHPLAHGGARRRSPRPRPGWSRPSTTSAARRRSATCSSPAAIRWP